ncbi:hypothetical protein AMTR_s00016p00099330 [Amborella trichopoda]|uniref:Uncharacterized protein n=1 Tax=Amborella trichopoda TaxID=13333 RepID=W1P8D4_AMBTC|nr:hypothetical protein AMTR_s00016p00099330 [Amborella trichopoda]
MVVAPTPQYAIQEKITIFGTPMAFFGEIKRVPVAKPPMGVCALAAEPLVKHGASGSRTGAPNEVDGEQLAMTCTIFQEGLMKYPIKIHPRGVITISKSKSY